MTKWAKVKSLEEIMQSAKVLTLQKSTNLLHWGSGCAFFQIWLTLVEMKTPSYFGSGVAKLWAPPTSDEFGNQWMSNFREPKQPNRKRMEKRFSGEFTIARLLFWRCRFTVTAQMILFALQFLLTVAGLNILIQSLEKTCFCWLW